MSLATTTRTIHAPLESVFEAVAHIERFQEVVPDIVNVEFLRETRPAADGAVELSMVMEGRAYRFLAKLMNPLIMGFVRKAIAKDMDAVKAFCEDRATSS